FLTARSRVVGGGAGTGRVGRSLLDRLGQSLLDRLGRSLLDRRARARSCANVSGSTRIVARTSAASSSSAVTALSPIPQSTQALGAGSGAGERSRIFFMRTPLRFGPPRYPYEDIFL